LPGVELRVPLTNGGRENVAVPGADPPGPKLLVRSASLTAGYVGAKQRSFPAGADVLV